MQKYVFCIGFFFKPNSDQWLSCAPLSSEPRPVNLWWGAQWGHLKYKIIWIFFDFYDSIFYSIQAILKFTKYHEKLWYDILLSHDFYDFKWHTTTDSLFLASYYTYSSYYKYCYDFWQIILLFYITSLLLYFSQKR